MDFYLLLKTFWAQKKTFIAQKKTWAINTVKNFLIVLKNIHKCNKNCIKKSNSKTAETTGDSTGNKIADKIKSVWKKSNKELQNDETEVGAERTTDKKRYISPEEKNKSLMN